MMVGGLRFTQPEFEYMPMRVFSSVALAFFLLCCCIAANAQENRVAQVCVALPHGGTAISIAAAGQRLVKALDHEKPDKKLGLSIRAIAVEAPSAAGALVEAKGKSCEFVLFTSMTTLATTYAMSSNGVGIGETDQIPVFNTAVEYRLANAKDGAGIAVGWAKGEDQSSLQDAASHAMTQVARRVVADIAKGGDDFHETGLTTGDRSTATSSVQAFTSNSCAWMPSDIPHSDGLRGVCEYALSLQEKMPNFICDQAASRYRGASKVATDLVTASVRYENGNESYDDIKVNGHPAPKAITQSAGLWSTGEFGSNLRSIFDPRNQPVFAFSGERKLGEHWAWAFTYQIAKQNNPLWRLHSEYQVVAPPYRGELWVDQKTGELLHFDSSARDLPESFPMTSAELRIDYASVGFGSGSSFVLPADFTVTTAYMGQEATRNVVQFRNCHRFEAKAHMVLNVTRGAGGPDAVHDAGSDRETEARELEQANQIYDILRAQAVREDEESIEFERKQELNAASVAAFWKIAGLRKELEASEEVKSTDVAHASEKGSETLPTLKLKANLVPVSVVLLDAKGHAVGNLKKNDFQLFDNGKPQVITSFSLERGGTRAGEEKPAKASAAEASDGVASRGASVGERSVAYVFDDIHTTSEDLAAAREAASRHIANLRAEDKAAIYTTSGEVGVDFTADREALQEALRKLRPHPVDHGIKCPPISPYMADLIVNQGDREALGLATRDAVNCAFGGAASAMELPRAEQIAKSMAFEVMNASSTESRTTLGMLGEVVRRTMIAPGIRSIVLVSSGFLAMTPDARQSVIELIDSAAQAEIVVNTLDVRGLYTVGLSPDRSHPSNSVVMFKLDREEAAARGDVMAEFAYGTGGTYFHNNNDLNEGFRRTAGAPEYSYVLGFSPQKLDGKFHRLKVTVTGQVKLTVQARKEYYAVKTDAKQ
jgi:VWFA-related protein